MHTQSSSLEAICSELSTACLSNSQNMANLPILALLLIASLSAGGSTIQVEARRLLETALPELPKAELPPLDPHIPTLPKPELPPLPKMELPPLPHVPELPEPNLPTLPKPEVPKLPEIPADLPHLPELPKPTLPNTPTFSPPHSTTTP